MTTPVPWSLAWREDGELAPPDLFDLMQTLVGSESMDVQPALVAAVERLSIADLNVIATQEVTGLCA